MSAFAILPMRPDELDAVAGLEARLQPLGWSRQQFAGSLANSLHRARVMVDAGRVVAYMVFAIVCDEAELLILGVEPECQRQGLASRLLDHMHEAVQAAGCARVFLEVRVSNAPARALYARHGFVQVGRRAGYYATATGREDALIMRAQP